MNKNNIVIFEDKNGNVELRADVGRDTLWATQEQISTLFESERSVITKHLKNIFADRELKEGSVCAKFAHTAADGKKYKVKSYNLDAIIAVGYRVNSKKATQFRIWATRILHGYLINGYNLNQYQLAKSAEGLDGLREAIALVESKAHRGILKGKITIKLTKNLIP